MLEKNTSLALVVRSIVQHSPMHAVCCLLLHIILLWWCSLPSGSNKPVLHYNCAMLYAFIIACPALVIKTLCENLHQLWCADVMLLMVVATCQLVRMYCMLHLMLVKCVLPNEPLVALTVVDMA